MPGVLDVTQKILSLTNIQKVTGAMNLIAGIRFRKLASKQKALELFEHELAGALSAVVPAFVREKVPIAADRPALQRTLAVLFTSDRGLCGPHNHAVHKALDRLARETQDAGGTLEAVCLGNKGAAYARRHGCPVVRQIEMKTLAASPELRALADDVIERFLTGRTDTVVLIYNRYISTLRQATQTRTVLPLGRMSLGEAGVEPSFDPAVEPFAAQAGSLLVRCLLAVALGHSLVSEQAARMTAMDSASKNARDLTNQAVKERNRVRQAGITSEVIEIISGKEAMKR